MNYSAKIQKAFNEFNGKNLDFLDQFYASDIVFEDPVTQIKGLKALKDYYQHAYSRVKSIRFDFHDFIENGNRVAAAWRMTLVVQGLNSGKEFTVPGMSAFSFNEQGLVVSHRDYLDLGDMVYERIPIQGMIIKAIKRMLSHQG